jgi:hypothetical protein
MYPETEAFLRGLFGRCGQAGQPEFLTLTAIHPGGGLSSPSRHVPLADKVALAEAMDRLLTANSQGWGAYITVAPRQANLGRWSRGGKGDLAELPALFIDADEPEAVLEKLQRFPLPPSCLVSSGKGIHAYWLLRQPTRNFAEADRTLRGLARYFDSDPRMTIAQSMRLPGSINTKENRGNAQCRLMEFHPQCLYNLEEFKGYRELPLRVHPRIGRSQSAHSQGQFREVIEEVTSFLCRNFDGYEKRNGWIAALCPCGHTHDRPGKHFNWHPRLGVAMCFGRHGKLSLSEMCSQLSIPLSSAA